MSQSQELEVYCNQLMLGAVQKKAPSVPLQSWHEQLSAALERQLKACNTKEQVDHVVVDFFEQQAQRLMQKQQLEKMPKDVLMGYAKTLMYMAMDVHSVHQSSFWQKIQDAKKQPKTVQTDTKGHLNATVSAWVGQVKKVLLAHPDQPKRSNVDVQANALHGLWLWSLGVKENISSLSQYAKVYLLGQPVDGVLKEYETKVCTTYNLNGIEDTVASNPWVRLERLMQLERHLKALSERFAIAPQALGYQVQIQLTDQQTERDIFERSASAHLNIYKDGGLKKHLRALLAGCGLHSQMQISFDPSSPMAAFDLAHEWWHITDHLMYRHVRAQLPPELMDISAVVEQQWEPLQECTNWDVFKGWVANEPDESLKIQKQLMACRQLVKKEVETASQGQLEDEKKYAKLAQLFEDIQHHFPQVVQCISNWCERQRQIGAGVHAGAKKVEQSDPWHVHVWMDRLLNPSSHQYVNAPDAHGLFYSQTHAYLRALDPQLERDFLVFWSAMQEGTLEQLQKCSLENTQQYATLKQHLSAQLSSVLKDSSVPWICKGGQAGVERRLEQWVYHTVNAHILQHSGYQFDATQWFNPRQMNRPTLKQAEEQMLQLEQQLLGADTSVLVRVRRAFEQVHIRELQKLGTQMHTMSLPVLSQSTYVQKTLTLAHKEGPYWSLPTEMCARAVSEPMPWLQAYQTDPYPLVREQTQAALSTLVHTWSHRLGMSTQVQPKDQNDQQDAQGPGQLSFTTRLALWHQSKHNNMPVTKQEQKSNTTVSNAAWSLGG